MAYSISTSVNKNTNLAGARSSPKAPKVRALLKTKRTYCQFCLVPLRVLSKKASSRAVVLGNGFICEKTAFVSKVSEMQPGFWLRKDR